MFTLSSNRRMLTLVCGFGIVVSTFSGCSKAPGTIPVGGKITYRGKPVLKAEVQFTPVESGADGALRRIAAGEVDSQGVYSLSTFRKGDGALPGEYVVTITPVKIKNIDGGDPSAKMQKIAPDIYMQTSATPLKASIQADASGSLTLDFDLKD
jgi:hypothetical protein